jgi:phytoene desaturase
VELASGECNPADIMVSNADAAWTCRNQVEPKYRQHWSDKKIEKGRYSVGLFDIFKRKKLSTDFSLDPHRPTATDPSLARACRAC